MVHLVELHADAAHSSIGNVDQLDNVADTHGGIPEALDRPEPKRDDLDFVSAGERPQMALLSLKEVVEDSSASSRPHATELVLVEELG